MASPQKEKGFTPIAHEILEHISKLSLNGTQFRIIMIVWRYTYGFNRKYHNLSETFISKAIGTSRPTISRELKVLFDMNILIIFEKPTFNTSAVIGFNKNHEQWKQVLDTSTGIELDTSTGIELDTSTGIELDTSTGIELDTSTGIELDTQEINNKEILNKDINKGDIDLFFETIWKLYPNKKGKGSVKKTQRKILYDIGFFAIKQSLDRYIKDKEEWRAYKDGSTFFNTGYIDYLDENYLQEQEEPKRTIHNSNMEGLDIHGY